MCSESAAEDLHPTQHDGAGLHRDRYCVGAPLALRGRVFRQYALPICESTLRFANELAAVRVNVTAILNPGI